MEGWRQFLFDAPAKLRNFNMFSLLSLSAAVRIKYSSASRVSPLKWRRNLGFKMEIKWRPQTAIYITMLPFIVPGIK